MTHKGQHNQCTALLMEQFFVYSVSIGMSVQIFWLNIFLNKYFFLFLQENICCDTHLRQLGKVLLMSNQ